MVCIRFANDMVHYYYLWFGLALLMTGAGGVAVAVVRVSTVS